MTPESAGIQLVAEVIARLGATPILLFLAVIFLFPTSVQIWANHKQDKRLTKVFERQDHRFEQVVQMYKDNVELVKDVTSVTKDYHNITSELQDLVLLTGQTMQKLVDTGEKSTELMITMIKGNTFCPIVRQRTGPGTIEEGGG